MGEKNLTFAPEVAVSRDFEIVRVALNAGYRFRAPSQVLDLDVQNEIFYRVGVATPLARWFDVPMEVGASLGGQDSSVGSVRDVAANPLELLGEVKYDISANVQTHVGAGVGLIAGYATPDFRVFAGMQFVNAEEVKAPPPSPPEPVVCEAGPEDDDGFQDGDACNDPDNDQDMILDAADACRDDPEDKDDFEDEDGCPDPDNDKDTILDAADACKNEPETLNDFKDEDGCPDSRPIVVVTKQKIEILEKVYFDTDRDTIKPVSFAVLDAVAMVLASHPEIAKIVIEGHTDADGPAAHNSDLSQRRALAVRKYLVDKGINVSRMDAKGYGEDRPIAENTAAESKEQNRRVEFVILEGGGSGIEGTDQR